jgi:hypothetical protein
MMDNNENITYAVCRRNALRPFMVAALKLLAKHKDN